MMTLEQLFNNTVKQFMSVNQSTFFILFILILINIYDLYKYNLGKLFSLIAVIYILNKNITLGIVSFLIVLLLNNKSSVEGFENKDSDESKVKDVNNSKDAKDINVPKTNDKNKDTNESDLENVSINDDNAELNDPIASFKKLHCKNGKVMKDGIEINISDMATTFPQLKFNLENEKCNPCEDNCGFKITSSKELLTVEESLRPKSSTSVSSE